MPDVAERPFDAAHLREMWDFRDPAASEARFAAAASDRSRPPSHRAELATQRARALGLQGRFDEADDVLDAVLDGADVPPPVGGVVGVRVALERGRLRRSAGDPAAAVVHLRAAASVAERIGATALEVDALHMLALADADRAEEWTARALGVVAGSTDLEVRRWEVALQNNLGWARHDAGAYDDALAAFRAAHRAALEVGTVEQEQIGRWAVARCLRSMGRFDEARALQEQLAVERPDDGYVAEELARLAAGERD